MAEATLTSASERNKRCKIASIPVCTGTAYFLPPPEVPA